ncbi:hypothetical protein [Cellulomonas soli]|uniref:Fibronectin type-III domain-containing protein n=1 Tax=Cellulomonas soli TaxID=931535 RepID=A0A512PHK0_9CELL|nr:hypothetical protein [Cellulomonas soli]NYI59166.1 hypothetical protein [Cellulomonas soli]GEP70670.1 hypothetical protein CSO01_33850 [Cellulomonas soli]
MSTPPAPPAALPATPSLYPTRAGACRARFAAWRARTARDDGGFGLAELVVVCALVGVLVAIGGALMHRVNGQQHEAQERVEVTTGIDDASGQLLRDVNDAISIRQATAQSLTLAVVRDGSCNIRAYTADSTAQTLTVVTTFYEGAACSGASEDREQVLLQRYTAPATFTYWGESDEIPIPAPVEDVRNITRVQWGLAAAPYADRTAPDVTLMSSAFFDGRGESSGSGTPELQAKRPLLTVTTVVPGRDAPTITWTDPSPTLTAGWVVTRAREPEGSKPGTFLAIAWPAKSTLNFTDTSLQPGERASFVIYAILTDGSSGPSSNSVDTGLRPPPVTGVTATGQATSIKVDWAASSGATGYDVYRDGFLIANVGAVTSYTDALTFGHSHDYVLVPTNRWEQQLTTGTESGRVPLGDAITKAYTGGVRLASAVTAAAGAFTAPAAPTITATPNADWTNTVTRTYAPWVGTGPTSKAGARDRGWETQVATLTGAFTDLWAEATAASQTQSARPAGATTRYQARTCNAVGCGPYSTPVSALQRPPAPGSCTTAGASTRGMQVTVNPAVMESAATGYRVAGGIGTPVGGAAQSGTVFNIDQLTHSSLHTFTASTQNGSPAGGGWSDTTACQGTTAVLGVAITGVSSTTRSVSASMSVTNGNASSLTLEGVRTDQNVGSASWDPLADGSDFTVTARNTDGWNNVLDQRAISTQVLAAPSAPTCTVTVVDADAPGSITVSGGDQVRLGSGGGVLSSPHTYGSLDAGTFVGYARRVTSDGYNSANSAWDGCPTVTISDPYPTPWGERAGCPAIGVPIYSTSPRSWQVRRASATLCQLRWVVTDAGETYEFPPGTVVGTGTYTIGSGASVYTRTSGDTALAMGPTVA